MSSTTAHKIGNAKTTKRASKQKADEDSNKGDASVDTEASLDIGACSLCHCALDYSDRAAFFPKDREEDVHDDDADNYYFRETDPYLPKELHDPNNALVYCDSCPRLFHQKCHFVPVLVLPASHAKWHCLVCQTQKALSSKARQKKKYGAMYDKLFRSPPVEAVQEKERDWDLEPAVIAQKVSSLTTELASFVKAALRTTRAYRQASQRFEIVSQNAHLLQELDQTASTVVTQKYKLHWLFRTLQRTIRHHCPDPRAVFKPPSVRLSSPPSVTAKAASASSSTYETAEFITRVLYPFGLQWAVRTTPVTPEFHNTAQSNDTRKTATTNDDDDDEGFSLDALQCCVCTGSDSSDANDMILCDGQQCCRAYHVQCLSKAAVASANLDDEDNEDDWFCPLCVCEAETLQKVQELIADDEDAEKDDATSMDSWNGAADVFPEALEQFEALAAGDNVAATLAGDNDEEREDDDSDNVDEDGHFDLESFHKEREIERAELAKKNASDNDESTHSSKATLVDMSSVELEIGKAELAALSDLEEYDDSDDSALPRRRPRRRRSSAQSMNKTIDAGKFSTDNILPGRRKRKSVDYQKLNDSIFGSLSDTEALDGGDDYVVSAVSRKKAALEEQSSESGSDDDTNKDNDDSQSSDDDSSNSASS